MGSRSGEFKRKYEFASLTEIGDTLVIRNTLLSSVRTAATMYGTRYGVWLKVEKIPEGAKVTRVEAAPGWDRKPSSLGKTDKQLLKECHDSLRCLTVLVCKLSATVGEIQKRLEE